MVKKIFLLIRTRSTKRKKDYWQAFENSEHWEKKVKQVFFFFKMTLKVPSGLHIQVSVRLQILVRLLSKEAHGNNFF